MTSRIETFSDQVLHAMLVEAPDIAQLLGKHEVGGRELPELRLPDNSVTAAQRRCRMVADWASQLEAMPRDDDQECDRVTRATLEFILNDGFQFRFHGRAGAAYADHIDPVTHLSGAYPTGAAMIARATNQGEKLSLLRQLPQALRVDAEMINARCREGWLLPREIAERAAADLRNAARLRSLPAMIQSPDAELLFEERVAPAMATLAEALDRHADQRRESGSVLDRPGGDAFFAWRFRGHSTSTVTPEEAHHIGHEELARLHDELCQEFGRLGFKGSLKQCLDAWLQADRAEPGATGWAQTESYVRATIGRMEGELRPFFNLWPSAAVKVELIGEADEASQHSTYIPPVPGRPHGLFLLNLALTAQQTFGDIALLCYHESWPGHHLQLALAQELPLPAMRRTLLFNAYLEGWAKWAESLPEAMGVEQSRFARLARLRGELYSTATLVLDTGIHVHGWGLDEARRYFAEQTGAGAEMASMVTLRSAEDPGHLSSYKIGLLKMRELHQRYQARRGAAYRIQDFHDLILGGGALPLEILEARVEQALTCH